MSKTGLTKENLNELASEVSKAFSVKLAEIVQMTWNTALEEAAKAATDEGDYNPSSYYVDAIRKLKI